MPSVPLVPPRAGFWRRVGAFAIDMLICGLVIAVLGTTAFALTGGRVQTDPFAITTSSCTGRQAIPADLTPPPPEGSNYVLDCTSGTFPSLPMTRALVVGRRETSPGQEVKTWVSYPLAADGSRTPPFDASWIGQVGVVAYLATFLCRRGTTLGMRTLRIRMLQLPDPERPGVPLLKLVIRAAVIVAGFLPAIAIGIAALVWVRKDPEHVPTTTFVLLTLLAVAIWTCWNAILAGRKLDPVYDRVSDLAVVRSR